MDKSEFNNLINILENDRERIIKEQKAHSERRKKEHDELWRDIMDIIHSPPKEDTNIEILQGKPQVQINDEGVFCIWNKDIFLFDKEGYNLFNQKFNQVLYDFVKVNTKSGKYLAMIKKGENALIFFHRWLMENEIFNFAFENNISDKYEIVVHHKNFNPSLNNRENLQVMTREEHNKLHNREDKKEEND